MGLTTFSSPLVLRARPFLDHALDKEEFQDLADPTRLENNFVESGMFQMIEALLLVFGIQLPSSHVWDRYLP